MAKFTPRETKVIQAYLDDRIASAESTVAKLKASKPHKGIAWDANTLKYWQHVVGALKWAKSTCDSQQASIDGAKAYGNGTTVEQQADGPVASMP